jgi:hypothetical protein
VAVPNKKEKVFFAHEMVPSDTINLKTVRPFGPGEVIDNEDGTFSTERGVSFNIDGKEVLVPSLWMTPDGPVDLSRNPEINIRAAMAFERRTGNKFPRFETLKQATEFSKLKSRSK